MKNLILLLAATLSLSVASATAEPPASSPNEPAATGPKRTRQEMKKEVRDQIKAKREMVHQKIMEACGPEIQAAGCSGKEGGEMVKCMREYKEAHKDFKPSDACREAHGDMREFRHEKKEMKKELRHKIHQGAGTPTIPPTSGTTTPSP